jgi:hypothetical protein
MYNYVEPEEKYLAELRWQIMTEVADEDPFIWAMINWKLELKPYQQLLDEWKLKPSTLTYHWKKFKDECLLAELKLRDSNPYLDEIVSEKLGEKNDAKTKEGCAKENGSDPGTSSERTDS